MATVKARKQVYWQEDERVDAPDMTAVQTYARLRSQDIVQFLAGRAPRAGHTGRTWMPYTVWALNGSGITFEPAIGSRIRIATGLRLVLTGGDTGDAGDVIEVSEEVTLNSSCPTVGTPLLLLMARIGSSLVDGDNDDRVFYKTSDGTEETQNVATTQRRDINWGVVDATDGAAITAAEASGYEWVAELDYNGGAHQVSAWYYVFPESEVGGGALVESGMSFLWGLKRGLEAAYGGSKAWTDTPDNTLEDDELHATDLYAIAQLILGRTAGSTTGASILAIANPMIGSFDVYRVATGVAPAADAPNSILSAWRSSTAGYHTVAPGLVLSATNYADYRFGYGGPQFRAMKDAAGNWIIRFQSSTGTDYLTLRSDKRIESTNLTRVVRDLPIEYAQPAVGTGAQPEYLTVVYVAASSSPVLRVASLGLGHLGVFGAAAITGVILDDGNNWARVQTDAASPQVFFKEAAGDLRANLASYNGGRDVWVVFSNGFRVRIVHDAAAATFLPVYFDAAYAPSGIAAVTASGVNEAVPQDGHFLWRECSGGLQELWEWNEDNRRWQTIQLTEPSASNLRLAVLRLAIPRSYAGVGGVRNERLVSVTADCQTGAGTTLRLYLYEGTDSVGTDGAGNDYVEWTPTQSGEKTLLIDPALLDADGTTTQIAAVWQVYSATVPVVYVKRARETTDVYLMPGR